MASVICLFKQFATVSFNCKLFMAELLFHLSLWWSLKRTKLTSCHLCSLSLAFRHLISSSGVSSKCTVLGSLSTPTKRSFESGMPQFYQSLTWLCFAVHACYYYLRSLDWRAQHGWINSCSRRNGNVTDTGNATLNISARGSKFWTCTCTLAHDLRQLQSR